MGFAGPRVVEVTNLNLHPRVQTGECQYEHGMIDLLVNRKELRQTLQMLLQWFTGTRPPRAANTIEGAADLLEGMDDQ